MGPRTPVGLGRVAPRCSNTIEAKKPEKLDSDLDFFVAGSNPIRGSRALRVRAGSGKPPAPAVVRRRATDAASRPPGLRATCAPPAARAGTARRAAPVSAANTAANPSCRRGLGSGGLSVRGRSACSEQPRNGGRGGAP